MSVLVTSSAGFIGAAVSERLQARGAQVIGGDNLAPYYDVELNKARLRRCTSSADFVDARVNIADRKALAEVFAAEHPGRIVNLAAQAGDRRSHGAHLPGRVLNSGGQRSSSVPRPTRNGRLRITNGRGETAGAIDGISGSALGY